MPASAELKEHYDMHGYVIAPGLLTPSEHADLLAATNRVVARTRSGSWPHARVVGKQFPPYGVGDDIWGVQHAMHPALEEPIFARWYTGDAVREAAKMLLGCQDEELQMGGFPSSHKKNHRGTVSKGFLEKVLCYCTPKFFFGNSEQALSARVRSAQHSRCGTMGYDSEFLDALCPTTI